MKEIVTQVKNKNRVNFATKRITADFYYPRAKQTTPNKRTTWHRHRWNRPRKRHPKSDETHRNRRRRPQLPSTSMRSRQSLRERSTHSHGWESFAFRHCSFVRAKRKARKPATLSVLPTMKMMNFSVFFRAINIKHTESIHFPIK